MGADAYFRIWCVVGFIPRGKVATYGQIARLAGLGGHARMVGYALHATPADRDIPWHRVINARGRISLPREDGRYDMQRALLAAEGIQFTGETIALAEFRWQPDREELLKIWSFCADPAPSENSGDRPRY